MVIIGVIVEHRELFALSNSRDEKVRQTDSAVQSLPRKFLHDIYGPIKVCLDDWDERES